MADPLSLVSNTNTIYNTGNGGQRYLEGTRDGAAFMADYRMKMALAGRIFCAADAAVGDIVGASPTSFAVTTPTFIIDVPTGTTCLPLKVNLSQAASVAGAVIHVAIAICSTATSFASGGTAEQIFGARNDRPVAPLCAFYSLPTCTTALLTKEIYHVQMGPDISPAEGAVPEVLWTPEKNGHPQILVGPASFAVFTYAASTGPMWNWSISWAEMPSAWVAG